MITLTKRTLTKTPMPPVGEIVIYDDKKYLVSDDEPKNNDLVVSEWGVWTFKFDPKGVPMPYWGNKNACKKLILQ